MISKPKEFTELDFMELWAYSSDSQGTSGGVILYTDSNSRTAGFGVVTTQRLYFITEPRSEDQFQYKFDGTFLRGGMLMDAPADKPVLKGILTKLKNGQKTAEREVKFRIEYHGC